MAQVEIRLLPLSYSESREIILSEGSFLIGRETQMFRGRNDNRLKKLSREHARLDISGHLACLFDLGSTNGTKINNVPIATDEPNPLKDGDIISFANVFDYQLKIVSCHSEDTQITQLTGDHDSEGRVVSNKTLFLASADSYLDMLCEEDISSDEESGQQPARTIKPLFMAIAAMLILTIVGGITFYWVYF